MRRRIAIIASVLIACTAQAQQSMTVHDSARMHSHEGSEMTVEMDLYIDGALNSSRSTDSGHPLIYFTGDTMDIHPISGDLSTYPEGNRGAEIIFHSETRQSLKGGSTGLNDENSYLPNLSIDNPDNLHLQREAAGALYGIHFRRGHVILDSMDFIAGSSTAKAEISGYDETRYFVTNGSPDQDSSGFLISYLDGTETHWPIGLDDDQYTPAAMTLTAGSAQQMKVRSWFGAAESGFGAPDISNESCGNTWDITATGTDPTVSLRLAHVNYREGAAYAIGRSNGFITRHIGEAPNNAGDVLSLSEWDLLTTGSEGEACDISSGPPLNTHAMHTRHQVSNFGPFSKALTSDMSPLPVELLAFDVEKSNRDALLFWNTASEIDNAGFEVEYSLDGIQFVMVGYVEGAGNSSTIQNYTFLHPEPGEGVHYYRLKQVDFDGEFEYSPMRTVSFESLYERPSSELLVFPNPASQSTSLSLIHDDLKIIQVFDARLNEVITVNNVSTHQFTLDISGLARGTYIVIANLDTSTATRLVKN